MSVILVPSCHVIKFLQPIDRTPENKISTGARSSNELQKFDIKIIQ